MKEQTLVHKPLPQNPDIWVSVPNYKEPILPVSGGFGWYGLQAYDFQGDKPMCCICGEFRDSLGVHVAKMHKQLMRDYKRTFGLPITKQCRATSLGLHEKKYNESINNVEKMARIKKLGKSQGRKRGEFKGRSLEYYNKNDTCKAQLLRHLSECAQVYGKDVTEKQANMHRPGLHDLLVRNFGSFNKAKQILQLDSNIAMSKGEVNFEKQLLLEDIISFYRKHKKYPTLRAYNLGLMICSRQPLYKYGGITKLVPEAMKLKDEQDKRNNIDINAIANKIEMEYAGRARV